METLKTFGTSFIIKKQKADKESKLPIYMRITVDGKRIEFSTKEWIEEKKWQNGRPIGNTSIAKSISNILDAYSSKARECYHYLIDRSENITPQKIADMMRGRKTTDKSLLWLCDKYIENISNLVDNGYADATLTRYQTTKRHIEAFLKKKYKKDDILITELNYDFISDFEIYFKRTRKCNHNTSMKYLKNLKAIVNLAVKNDWLDKDPFRKFTCKIEPVERGYLTEEEIVRINEKDISIERLAIIRDAFILSCFTGLSYIDIKQLRKENIVKGVDRQNWIFINRGKTNVLSKVPIMPIAEEIIAKYEKQEYYKKTGYIIPVPSNQKVNAYLKEIADLAEITKNLTFHVARHSFATLALSYGMSIESVSKMLGHNQIRTTQIYAKVTEKKIAKEMTLFKNRNVKQ